MLLVLCVIYIIFIALGLPDSLLGVVWPVVHLEFGLPESFASVFSIIVSFGTGGVSFVAGMLLRKFGTAKVALASILITAIGLVGIGFLIHHNIHETRILMTQTIMILSPNMRSQ